MSQHGTVPTRAEVAAELQRMSEQIHGDSQRGVSITVFDRRRPDGWACSKIIFRELGYNQWADMVRDLCGWIAVYRGRDLASPEIDRPPDRLDRSEYMQAASYRDEWALPCRPVEAVDYRWNHRTECYDAVPCDTEERYKLR